MKNWDNKSKKDLIMKLTESSDYDSIKKNDFSFCFDAWEDTRTADKIIIDLHADRVNNNETEEYWRNPIYINCKFQLKLFKSPN